MEISKFPQWFRKTLPLRGQKTGYKYILPGKFSNFQPNCLADFQNIVDLSDSALGSKILEIKKNYAQVRISDSIMFFV